MLPQELVVDKVLYTTFQKYEQNTPVSKQKNALHLPKKSQNRVKHSINKEPSLELNKCPLSQ